MAQLTFECLTDAEIEELRADVAINWPRARVKLPEPDFMTVDEVFSHYESIRSELLAAND